MPVNASKVHFWISPIEEYISYEEYREFAIKRPHIPVIGITIYLSLLFVGQKVMQRREPLTLKPVLLVWNICLAIFSILTTTRLASLFLYRIKNFDQHDFFCHSDEDDVTGFWYMLFVCSKFAEFGDTFFLVVRKKKIMFLHWYHHVTVLLMSWLVFVEMAAVGPFFGSVNVFVHSFMYTYYAAQTVGIRFNKLVPMALTILQTMQMLVGLSVVYQVNRLASHERGCNASLLVTSSASIMYASYFILFARFFVKSYITSPTITKSNVNGNHNKMN